MREQQEASRKKAPATPRIVAIRRRMLWGVVVACTAMLGLVFWGSSRRPHEKHPPRPPTPIRADMVGMVTRIIAGDIIVLDNTTHVRYIGIAMSDAAEIADLARRENARLALGRQARLVFDAERQDAAGRFLAYVYVDTICLNEYLVERGLALARPLPPNLARRDSIQTAEARARAAGLGLWQELEPSQ